MSYQVIARKYRPQRFADVVGQEHVTQTLANAIGQKRIAHAYLFCGPRARPSRRRSCSALPVPKFNSQGDHGRCRANYRCCLPALAGFVSPHSVGPGKAGAI